MISPSDEVMVLTVGGCLGRILISKLLILPKHFPRCGWKLEWIWQFSLNKNLNAHACTEVPTKWFMADLIWFISLPGQHQDSSTEPEYPTTHHCWESKTLETQVSSFPDIPKIKNSSMRDCTILLKLINSTPFSLLYIHEMKTNL